MLLRLSLNKIGGMAQEIPGVEHYQTMTSGFELPSDPKPVSETAIREREKAINEGRLHAPSRSAIRKAMEDALKPGSPAPAAEPEPTVRDVAALLLAIDQSLRDLEVRIMGALSPSTTPSLPANFPAPLDRRPEEPLPINHGSQTPVDRIDLTPTITCADPA